MFDISYLVSLALPWVFIVITVVGLVAYAMGKMHIDENDNSSSSRSNKASGQQISSQSTNQPSQQSSQQPPRQLPPTGGGI